MFGGEKFNRRELRFCLHLQFSAADDTSTYEGLSKTNGEQSRGACIRPSNVLESAR